MRLVALSHDTDFAGWRDSARAALAAAVPPGEIDWRVGTSAASDDLFANSTTMPENAAPTNAKVPRAFITLAETVIQHRDVDRFALLYRLLWGLQFQPKLLEDASHPDVHHAEQLAKAIRRDIHKMHAFVRFREVAEPDGAAAFIAWFEPDNHIVEAATPFFMRRFTGMRWSILTPDRCAFWDGETLRFGEGVSRDQAPTEDRLEALWRTYYANIFNPARLKVAAMTREMPQKYWKNLPEAELIGPLIREAASRRTSWSEPPQPRPPPRPRPRRSAEPHPHRAPRPSPAFVLGRPKTRAPRPVTAGASPV